MTHEDLMRQVFGLENAAVIHVLEQLKPKTHGLYQIESVNKRLIVKVYDHQHRSAARKEVRCHNLFSQLPFVAHLPYTFDKAGYTFLGYEWIDGQNLSDFLNSKHGQSLEVRERVLLQAVDQIIQMLEVSNKQPIHTSSLKLSFSNPLLKGLLLAEEEEQFKHDYEIVQRALDKICGLYSGLFLDRNPANMVYVPKDQELFQIDFGCVERTSPIFDLVQLFRTLTGEPSFVDQDMDSNAYRPIYLGETEKSILDYAFSRLVPLYGKTWEETEDFYRSFLYASFRFHIYYLTKAFGRIRDSDAYMRVQKGRIPYHMFLLKKTFQQLIDMREPVEILRQWVERFTHFY